MRAAGVPASMILGTGTDIVDARRIAAILDRHQDRFVNRIFTGAEQTAAAQSGDQAVFYSEKICRQRSGL